MKKTLTAILLVLVVCVPFGAYADFEVAKVYVDSKPVQFTKDTGLPFVNENDRTMVPLRAVMEAYGIDVTWEEKTESIILKSSDTTLNINIGSKKIKVNENDVIISDDAPVEINGRTYLPIRAVSEAFGAYVLWNDSLNSVFILSDNYIDFRNMFTYDGELSKYVDTVVVSAMYNGTMTKDEFKNFWTEIPIEELETTLKIIATDKKDINPNHEIHINFWYPSDSNDRSYYLASVSSISYDAKIYNPFDVVEINQLNQ